LWSALKGAIAYAVDGNFERLLAEAFGFADGAGAAVDDAELGRREARLRSRLGVRPEATQDGLAQELGAVLSQAEMRDLVTALRGGGKTDQERAEDLERALGATSPGGRVAALEACFLTQGKTPRARLATREGARPDLAAQLAAAQTRFVALHREQTALTVAEATMALARLSGDTLARYRAAKARLAVLDFDDLIAKAAGLLRSSAAVEWVLFKLDGGLDHILVDEAQDTSPVQWQVIRALAAEFFAGDGARQQARTLFAVGDEKQSIYGFQGAAPQMFAQAGAAFATAARRADRSWRQIPLTLSFRTVEPLLGAIDRIFSAPTRTPGVGGPDTPIAHVAHRFGHAGVLEIWPLEKPAPAEATSAWAPLEETSATHPVKRLAARIADTIKRWLETGERLASEARPVRPGDILILVRKRMPFAPAMVAALKARRIPVAGADRLILTEQIAVQDLIALGEVSLLPENDLALAALLKSPLFDLNDEHLISLAPGRPCSLWQALIERASKDAFWQAVADRLLRWQGEARRLAPFDFYASVLDCDGMRARMLARLGSEAADPLDEFLTQALAYEAAGPPSLQGFIAALGQARPEIKRDMEQGRDEVRVMTVHGAKGLEAPIVFLPDTCSTRSGRWPGSLLAVAEAASDGGPFLWPVRGAGALPAVDAARQAERQADKNELDRLLYVALTRARDRLYIAGFEGTREAPAECWYHLIHQGLDGHLVAVTVGENRSVWRLESAQTVAPQATAEVLSPSAGTVQPPAWIGRRAPTEPGASQPLRPSQLAPLADGGPGRGAPRPRQRPPSVPAPQALLEDARFLRGTLTHTLLEHLPAVGREDRQAAAAALLTSRAPDLDTKIRAQIIAETLAVLEHPELSALFGPDSRAEVPIVATLPSRDGTGPPLRLTGKIDRLVHTGRAVLIVDYKTNRPPPRQVAEVAEAYLLQLAAYRLGVAALFPGLEVRAALLWTDGARIMEIPRLLLDEHAQRLWTEGLASLDA
ncbi:MAG TPA: double-strand break repair helicase AddA, partial [Hyphomicrobiaceae bacterium]|nr:double-strand break repair helicase AddA [Hyphomicrobiaceae bacterium]